MGYKNVEPYELLVGTVEAWWAAAKTAKPAVDDEPSEAWTKIGTNGTLNYSDGQTFSHPQSITEWTPAGSTVPTKAWRTAEGTAFKLTLNDLTVEGLQLALNLNNIATVEASSGVPGTKTIGHTRGSEVATMALLVRGASPYMDGGVMQRYFPIVYVAGEPEITIQKGGDPAGLELEFRALGHLEAATESERTGSTTATTAQAGAGTVKVPVGAITVNVTEAGNIANTNEQDLWTYSLPAATLNANGRGVRITVWGTLAANANDKVAKLYMGGYLLSSSVTAMTVNNGLFRAQAEVIRTGAATEVGNASFYYGVLNGAQTYRANAFALALDTTAAIIIKVTGQSPTAGAANDVVFKGALVEVF